MLGSLSEVKYWLNFAMLDPGYLSFDVCRETYHVTITVTSYLARLHLKLPVSRLFIQTYVQKQIKENIKAPRRGLLWEIHQWPVNSLYKGPVTRKLFPFDDVIMYLII